MIAYHTKLDMNKNELLENLKKYNFNPDEFVILSGASLVMNGIKEQTHDIDIACTNNMYEYLKNNYNVVLERVNEVGENIYFIDDIINFGTTYNDVDFDIIDGYRCQSLESVKKLKRYLGRQKDFDDIKLIDTYIKKQSH